MLEFVLALALGLIAGLLIARALVRRAATSRVLQDFATWQATELERFRKQVLEAGRPALKRDVGFEVSRGLYEFPFRHADARFIGHPVEYVVFDGYSEVKGRLADALSSVVFVDVKTDEWGLSRDAQLVRECVEGGRLRWLTWTPHAIEEATV